MEICTTKIMNFQVYMICKFLCYSLTPSSDEFFHLQNKKVAVFDSKEDRLEREHSMSLDKSNTSQTVAHGKSRSGTVGATQSEKKIIPSPRRESVTITFNGLNTQGLKWFLFL